MIQQPQHLYIHWPFCSSKCHFCDFVAFEQHEDYQVAYHKKLCNEITSFAQQQELRQPIKTIFLGGGTPSLYPLDLLQELITTVNTSFDTQHLQEFSIETNPADIDEEKLDCWQELGISRISMGVQSLNDDVLLRLNRRQRAKDVMRCMRIAPKYFDNISVDFILGLPEVDAAMWFDTLKQAVTWPIKHMSVYFLTVHEKTPLYFKVNRGEVLLPADDALIAMYEQTVHFLTDNGFERYEVSNFALNNHVSLHNQAYWDRKPYKGFGIGASSFDGLNRSTNVKNLSTYLQIGEYSDLTDPSSIEKLTPQQELLELLMLSLRQKKGINLHSVLYLLSAAEKSRFIESVKNLVAAGLVEQNDETIYLTLRGMALENEVIVQLMPV